HLPLLRNHPRHPRSRIPPRPRHHPPLRPILRSRLLLRRPGTLSNAYPLVDHCDRRSFSPTRPINNLTCETFPRFGNRISIPEFRPSILNLNEGLQCKRKTLPGRTSLRHRAIPRPLLPIPQQAVSRLRMSNASAPC